MQLFSFHCGGSLPVAFQPLKQTNACFPLIVMFITLRLLETDEFVCWFHPQEVPSALAPLRRMISSQTLVPKETLTQSGTEATLTSSPTTASTTASDTLKEYVVRILLLRFHKTVFLNRFF